MFFPPSKSRQRANIQKVGVSKAIDQDTKPQSFKALNQDLKDMDVLCTFEQRYRAKIWNMDLTKTNVHILHKLSISKYEKILVTCLIAT